MNTLIRAAFFSFGLSLATTSVQSAVTEFVVPAGPTITLQDGRLIEGHVVKIDQTNVLILREDGNSEAIARSTISTIAFETVTGQEISGELIGWTPGVYQIATPEAAINVYSTMPATAAPPEQAIVAANRTADDGLVEDASQDNAQEVAVATVSETENGSADATPSTTAGTQDAAVTPSSSLSIAVTVENSRENGPPVAFNIELSEPSETSVVLIYATIDGTAVNGQDYEANRGVVVMKPGERVARIEAPIIDDDEQEEQEHLQLFLTVDPTVAVVENRQIIATIDDDDQG